MKTKINSLRTLLVALAFGLLFPFNLSLALDHESHALLTDGTPVVNIEPEAVANNGGGGGVTARVGTKVSEIIDGYGFVSVGKRGIWLGGSAPITILSEQDRISGFSAAPMIAYQRDDSINYFLFMLTPKAEKTFYAAPVVLATYAGVRGGMRFGPTDRFQAQGILGTYIMAQEWKKLKPGIELAFNIAGHAYTTISIAISYNFGAASSSGL